jgi:hypothetical protein
LVPAMTTRASRMTRGSQTNLLVLLTYLIRDNRDEYYASKGANRK